jgi:hypothetical protein
MFFSLFVVPEHPAEEAYASAPDNVMAADFPVTRKNAMVCSAMALVFNIFQLQQQT